jgi:hypothetical protein
MGYKQSLVLERKNFLSVDLSRFDYIYVYLLPEQMACIEDWMWKTKKKDAVIISNTFVFAKHEPFDVFCSQKGKKCISLYR